MKVTRLYENIIALVLAMLIGASYAQGKGDDAFLLDYFFNKGGGSSQSPYPPAGRGEDAFLLDYFFNKQGGVNNQTPTYPEVSPKNQNLWPITTRLVGHQRGNPIYISTEGLNRMKNGDILFWLLRSSEEAAFRNQMAFKSNTTMFQLDCKKRVAKQVADMLWSEQFMRGRLVSENTLEGNTFPIERTELGRQIFLNLCN